MSGSDYLHRAEPPKGERRGALPDEVFEDLDRLLTFNGLVKAFASIASRTPMWQIVATAAIATAQLALFVIVMGAESPSARATPILVMGFLVVAGAAAVHRLSSRLVAAYNLVDRLHRALGRDELTGVATQAHVYAEVRRLLTELGRGELLLVLYCDIDRMSLINESLGRAGGDAILAEVAARLEGVLQTDRHGGSEVESLVGRIGGDEFAIVTRDLPTVRDLDYLLTDIDRLLNEPMELGSGGATAARSQRVSVTIGAAYCLADEYLMGERPGPDALLGDAELALAEARRQGLGSRVAFSADLRNRAIARLELEQALRSALTSEQIIVHYQPLVDRATNEVVLFEALVRWEHPIHGMVHPADFLPVAAESSLIIDLGDVVLDRACAQVAEWTRRSGSSVAVSVNLDRRQVRDVRLMERVESALARHDLQPEQLVLEISEGELDELEPSARAMLTRLEQSGVRFAVDDFGANQAALGALRSWGLASSIKIDRSFVESIATNPVDYKVVAAIVALADEVGFDLIAEGVEDETQAEVLIQLGINLQQGFFYCRPGPASQVERLLFEGHPDGAVVGASLPVGG